MIKQRIKIAISAGLIAMGLVGSADAALIGRLAATPGGTDYQAYYDDGAKLTWLADANAAGTTMNWADANAWAAGLTVDGMSGWRLADTLQPDVSCGYQSGGVSSDFNCTGSEMGNLFYSVLGNTAGSLTNTGPFSNVQSNFYWSATEYAPDIYFAWGFDMSTGFQISPNKNDFYFGWAVQSGDVGAVPVPAAVWLFSSGLLGLVFTSRRKVYA